VTKFFAAVECQARKLLPTLSGQELADLSQAFSLAHSRPNTQLLQEIAQKATNRFADLSTEALLSLLRSLNADCNVAAQPYYDETLRRLNGMQKQEMIALSHICAKGLGLQCPPNGLSLDILQSCCQALSRALLSHPPGLSTVCPWSEHDIRNCNSADPDEPFNEMAEAFGGPDLFQATRARPVSCWLDRSGQHQWTEMHSLDLVETKKVDTLQRATDLVDPAQICQFRSSKVGKNFDMLNFGEDNSSFFSVDVPVEINCSISRFSIEPGFASGHSIPPPEQLPLYSGGFAL